MSATELVILSSSPARQLDFQVTPPSRGVHDRCRRNQQRGPISAGNSSPELPSVSKLLVSKRPGALKSGSRAAKVPEDAISGFATIASLVRDKKISLAPAEDDGGENADKGGSVKEGTGVDAGEARRKVPAKRARKAVKAVRQGEEEEPARKKPRKRKAPTQAESGGGEGKQDRNAVPLLACERKDEGDSQHRPPKDPDPPRPTSKVRKAQSTKDKSEKQSKIANCRITKPRARDGKAKPAGTGEQNLTAKSNKSEVVSKHFPQSAPSAVESKSTAIDQDIEKGLELEHALRRRIDWTPPKDTPLIVIGNSSDPVSDARDIPGGNQTRSGRFGDLAQAFGYEKGPDLPGQRRPADTATASVPTTKKRLELLETSLTMQDPPLAPKRATSPVKANAQARRKTTTITELATAQYRLQEPVCTTEAPQAALEQKTKSDFFAPKDHSGRMVAIVTLEASEVGTEPKKRAKKPRASSKTVEKGKNKPSKSNSQSRKSLPKILSPNTALKCLDAQNLLFGTSSQLAREESPAFIRDLQQAVRESEAAMSTQEMLGTSAGKSASRSKSLALVKASRGLWAAAARDHNQELLAAERPSGIDSTDGVQVECDRLSDQPQPTEPRRIPAINSAQLVTVANNKDGWLTLDEVVETDQPGEGDRSQAFVRVPDRSAAKTERGKSSVTIVQSLAEQQNGAETRAALKPLPANSKMPHAATTLGRKDTGSKPAPHSRSDSQNGVEFPEVSISPKRPRGRPRRIAAGDSDMKKVIKAPKSRPIEKKPSNRDLAPSTPTKQATNWTHIDEISDSEPEVSPSPPRRHQISSTVPSLPLSPSRRPAQDQQTSTAPSAKVAESALASESIESGWSSVRVTLFPQITRVIKAAPHTTDVSRPSWHEKILMYDPIVLEDLTAWLNQQGLRVPIWTAKGLKGRKGIKKTGKKGNDKAIRADQQIEMEELKPWMVQKWCEEMSICCLWKEGLRGGVRARY